MDDLADTVGAPQVQARLTALAVDLRGAGGSDPLAIEARALFAGRPAGLASFARQLDTIALDTGATCIAADAALDSYCMWVAGTVGIMVCALFDMAPQWHSRAADLGKAMQLTNICRDVIDDADAGRLYLPYHLCAHAPDAIAAGKSDARDDVRRAVAELLTRADALYASERIGLPALPLRLRLAVAAAASMYAGRLRRSAAGRSDPHGAWWRCGAPFHGLCFCTRTGAGRLRVCCAAAARRVPTPAGRSGHPFHGTGFPASFADDAGTWTCLVRKPVSKRATGSAGTVSFGLDAPSGQIVHHVIIADLAVPARSIGSGIISAPLWQTFLFGMIAVFALLLEVTIQPDLCLQLLLLAPLVAILGLPYGALDLPIVEVLWPLEGWRGKLWFVAVYLGLASAVIIVWILVPGVALAAFLACSVLHFSDDWSHATSPLKWTGGIATIGAPALFHPEEVDMLFAHLAAPAAADFSANVAAFTGALGLGIFIAICIFKPEARGQATVEQATLWGIGALLPPLLFFTVYFCGLHSLRHFSVTIQSVPRARRALVI